MSDTRSDSRTRTEAREPVDGRSLGDAEEAELFRTWPYRDRRSERDRRGRPTSPWRSLFLGGKRAAGRRKGEDKNIYVDVYGRREVVLVLLILVLNVLDAYFTLDYIQKGGSEANPVAQGLLDLGNHWFIYAKSLLVALCLIFLLVHKKFVWVDLALGFLVTFYSLLLGYHIVLQVRYFMAH